ncbi:MAG: hypothetical protein AAF430_05835 [Myxococcota bacterium]
MPTTDPAASPEPRSGGSAAFVLYVEGPRDRSILRAWAHRLMPRQAAALVANAVILGGRRPARAVEDFRERAAGSVGLCVLDRDTETPPDLDEAAEGLAFFTWSRRHIESYLLVPAAIRRALALPASDHRLESLLAELLPPEDDIAGWERFDAKRLLGTNGALVQELGRPVSLPRVARATRREELHPDVLALFQELEERIARVAPQRGRRGSRPARRRR